MSLVEKQAGVSMESNQDTEINVPTDMNFDKEATTIQQEREEIFNNGPGLTGYLHVEECKYIHIYHPAQSSSSNR